MYKKGLVLNNLQWLICHKTKPNQSSFYIQFQPQISTLLAIFFIKSYFSQPKIGGSSWCNG